MTKLIAFKLKKMNYLFSLSLLKQFSFKMNHELNEIEPVPQRVGLYNVKYRHNNEEHVTSILLEIGKHNKNLKKKIISTCRAFHA